MGSIKCNLGYVAPFSKKKRQITAKIHTPVNVDRNCRPIDHVLFSVKIRCLFILWLYSSQLVITHENQSIYIFFNLSFAIQAIHDKLSVCVYK